MGNRIGYYLQQSFFNIKTSLLVILAFSLTLSIISGLYFYSASYKDFLVKDDFSQLIDFNFRFSQSTLDPETAYENGDEELLAFMEEENVDTMEMAYYASFTSRYLQWFVNRSDLPVDFSSQISGDFGLDVNMYLFSDSFYETARYNDFFSILEGSQPQSEDEILLDFYMARLWDVHAGDTINISLQKAWDYQETYYYWDEAEDEYFSYGFDTYYENDENFYYSIEYTISGIFVSNYEHMRIANQEFFRNYEDVFLSSDYKIKNEFRTSPPVMGWYNFTNKTEFHPFMQLVSDIDSKFDESRSTHVCLIQYGMMGMYDRSQIKFGEFISNAEGISTENFILETFIYRNYAFVDYLTNDLEIIYQKSSRVRTASMLISIPITIFAILLGFFARKVETKTRMNEYLLLRSKGTSSGMILLQYLCESFVLGVVAIIIGTILGLINFFLFSNIYNQIFEISPFIDLPVIFNWDSLGNTILFGIITALLGSVSGIKYIVNVPANEILKMLGSDELDVVVDEKSLYQKKDKREIHTPDKDSKSKKKKKNRKSRDDKPDYIKYLPKEARHDLATIIDTQQLYQQMKVDSNHSLPPNEQGNSQIYDKMNQTQMSDPFEIKLKLLRKIGGVLMIIAFIPLILYVVANFDTYFKISDAFLQFISLFEGVKPILIYIGILSPILFSLGLIRLIIIEKPRIFAKISRKMSSWIIKGRDYLAGIEMVKQSQFKAIIFILALFISAYSFMNVYANTSIRHDYVIQNLEIGADFKVNLNGYNPNASSIAQIAEIESNLLSYIPEGSNEPIFEDLISVFCENDNDFNPDTRSIFYFNAEKYYGLISNEKKPQPNSNFVKTFTNYIEYISNPSNVVPGILVNDIYLENYGVEIFDQINLTHQYWKSNPGDLENRSFTVKIIGEVNYLPGLYNSERSDLNPEEYIIFDNTQFSYNSTTVLPSKNVIQMFDLNSNFEENIDLVKEYLYIATNNAIRYEDFQIYFQQWNNFNLSFQENALGFYIVLYLDFVLTGILIAVGTAILLLSIQKKNKYFNGVLLARGFGKKGLILLILSEIFIIFCFSFMIGTVTGIGFSSIYMKLSESTLMSIQGLHLPLYFNYVEFLLLLGGMIISTLLLTTLSFFIETRKSISKYMHKF